MRIHEHGSRKGPSRLLWFLVLAFAALALLAAGCGGDDDEGGAEGTTAAEGGGEGSIWVLLPDSASSARWEADDRRFFGEHFSEAGVDHTIVNAEGDALRIPTA